MLPRFILMTLIKKDQDGKSHPSTFLSVLIFLIAAAMVYVEIIGMNHAPQAPQTNLPQISSLVVDE